MPIAAAASAHQSPSPIPITPTMAAPAVSQSAFVHLRIGVEHLVVQAAGEWHLGPPEEESGDAASHQRREHQPTDPDRVAKHLDHADRRVLGGDEAQQ